MLIYYTPKSYHLSIFSPFNHSSVSLMKKAWLYPEKGFVKVNVHAFTLAQYLPNGNDSGMNIVFRDSRGIILKMYCGTITNITPQANE